VVFTCVGEKPERVRGVLGKLLHEVLTQWDGSFTLEIG
jgi:hypothetical protein